MRVADLVETAIYLLETQEVEEAKAILKVVKRALENHIYELHDLTDVRKKDMEIVTDEIMSEL